MLLGDELLAQLPWLEQKGEKLADYSALCGENKWVCNLIEAVRGGCRSCDEEWLLRGVSGGGKAKVLNKDCVSGAPLYLFTCAAEAVVKSSSPFCFRVA